MLDAKVKMCWRNGEKRGHPRNRIGNEVNIQASNIGVWYSLITGIPMVMALGLPHHSPGLKATEPAIESDVEGSHRPRQGDHTTLDVQK